jgi:Tfp pilus assembly protein PilF
MDRIDRLLEFLKGTPDDCFLMHALALEYIKAGDDTKAQQLFESNLHHDPAYIATYYHLGKLLERRNEGVKAISIYQEGMSIAKKMNDMHSYGELNMALEMAMDD